MENIGFVLYTKTSEPGILKAIWCHTIWGNGTGLAKSDSVDGYEGNYQITYYDTDGITIAERELKIIKDGINYKFEWYNLGEKTAEGLGMEINEGLAAGWHGIYS